MGEMKKGIKEFKRVKPSEITPYFNNPRKNDNAIEGVAESIQSFGFDVPIAVDEEGVILSGHTRWKAALKLELKSVPVVVIEGLAEEEKRAYRIADNRLSEFSFWDFEKLNIELDELSEKFKDLLRFDFDKIEKVNNESDEWVDMPEFEPGENDIKLIIYFASESDREAFVTEKKIEISRTQNNQWISRN